jgi:hypothetical protein
LYADGSNLDAEKINGMTHKINLVWLLYYYLLILKRKNYPAFRKRAIPPAKATCRGRSKTHDCGHEEEAQPKILSYLA